MLDSHFTGQWPVLETLLAENYLSSLEFGLAKELLEGHEHSESCAALICHLAIAARQGHLCIKIEGNEVLPDPLITWHEGSTSEKQTTSYEPIKELLASVKEMICHSVARLPKALMTEVREDQLDLCEVQTPLCRLGSCYYLQRYWYHESKFIKYYKEFTRHKPSILLEKENVIDRLRETGTANSLLPEQIQAILSACDQTLNIISGGPGTGKTYTAGILVSAIWDSLTDKQREKFEISLAAPTGKAADNLQKSLSKAAKGIDKLSTLQSKTLHALLGIKSGFSEEIMPLSSDLVIIDESSMIDVRLMGDLFSAMKPGARLVLLGDNHQLPAVGAGSLFGDFLSAYKKGGLKALQISELKTCLRAELASIVDLAEAINRGDGKKAVSLFESQKTGVSIFLKGCAHLKDKEITRWLSDFAFKCFEVHSLANLLPLELLTHFNNFRMLSPLRKGTFGVEELNKSMVKQYRNYLAKEGRGQPFIAPIILLKNDFEKELFNGEVGVLVKPSFLSHGEENELACGDYALFSNKNGECRKVPALLLPNFEYAYCLSVHKSQGSEFNHVFLILPSGAEVFGRELLYTAVTRARQQLTLWMKEEGVFYKAIEREGSRFSGVSERLYQSI